jgi:dihydrolipoamide dehydrogenase
VSAGGVDRIDVLVPDIGDFKDVAVIEVLVKVGDAVKVEQSLITVESDKASMEIPSSHAGVVAALQVRLGDVVNQGSLILRLDAPAAIPASGSGAPAGTGAAAAGAVVAASPPSSQRSAEGRASEDDVTLKGTAGDEVASPNRLGTDETAASKGTEFDCDLLVLGAGPGGYSAAFRAADLGLRVVLVERYPTLGGVCLNVGCIPSKALLHVASVMDEVSHFESLGIAYAKPTVDMAKLKAHKEKVVGKLTGGLAAMAKQRRVTVVHGRGEFVDSQHLQVTAPDATCQVFSFQRAIIAAGSEAVKLPLLQTPALKDDPRIVTSTGALELRQRPKRMLVIGGGIIGLEMATVYSTLGARVDVVEMQDKLMQGADRDLYKVWHKLNAPRFDQLMLQAKTVHAEATAGGVLVHFENLDGSAPEVKEQLYDLVLQAVGRTPNGLRIAADQAGVAVSERGFIGVDIQMRTNVPHIFAIGDIVGQPMLAHKAVHEGHVAAEVAAGELLHDTHLAKAAFDARVIPSVAYTDPEIAWVGLTEDDAKAQGIAVTKGLFPWAASGRAIANGRDEGFTKLLFSAATQAIVGGGIVGTHAGDMIGEVALAIEMGADAVDIGKTIHPHPTLGETIGLAGEAATGVCTDLMPVRR